ncbi:putative sulfate exporter family transporter [Escherichia coli]
MVLGNTIYPHIWKSCDGGVLFAKQYLLRLGIILYGFRLTFSQIADVGISGIIIDVLTLSSTFLLACFLGRKVFGLDKHTSWLIGAGSSICGAAAVLATEPVVKTKTSKVTRGCCNRCYLRDRRYFPLPGDISADVSMV